MAKKKGLWACGCSVTIKEILRQVNKYRMQTGKRPMSLCCLYRIRDKAADQFLEAYPDGNYGLERNPFIAERMVGNAYIFSASRALKLVRVAVRYRPPSNRGRRIGARFKNGKMVRAGR